MAMMPMAHLKPSPTRKAIHKGTTYGELNSEYRTVRDSGAVVTKTAADTFTVQTKANELRTYQLQGDQQLTWFITQIKDNYGNAIDRFPLQQSRWRVLARQNRIWRQYRYPKLRYQGDRKRLNSITECAEVGSDCYRPVTFKWQVDRTYQSAIGVTADASNIERDTANVIDLNGDGRTDLVAQINDNWYLFISDGKQLNQTYFYNTTSDDNSMQFADFNGDGLTDLLSKDSAGYWAVRFSQGSHLSNTGTRVNDRRDSAGKVRVMDIDQDGRAEILFYQGNNIPYLIYDVRFDGTQAQFSTNSSVSITSHEQMAILPGDFNGDGVVEFVYGYVSGAEKHEQWKVKLSSLDANKGNAQPDTIYQSDNNMGLVNTITYQPMTNSSVYSKGSAVSFPVINVLSSGHVVSRASSSDGIGGVLSIDYQYQGARVHAQGHGQLGFETLITTDSSEDVTVVSQTTYHQDYPYIGVPKQTVKTINGEVLARSTHNDLTQLTTRTSTDSTAKVNPYHAYVATVTDERFDVKTNHMYPTGSGSPFKVSTTTTTSTYDTDVNLTSSTVTVTDGTESFITLSSHYYGDEQSQCSNVASNTLDGDYLKRFGRVTCSVVIKNNSSTRTAAFEYYDNGMLKTEIKMPGHDKALTTSYEYDSYGNTIKTTVSGKDYDPQNQSYSGTVSRTTSVDYSAYAGRYPGTKTNAKGHVTTYTYDSLTGQVKTKTFNNLTTTNHFDAMGAIIATTSPLGLVTATTSQWCDSIFCPSNAAYRVTSTADGVPDSHVYFDNFGREVATQTTAFDGTNTYTNKVYDAKGRVTESYEPSSNITGGSYKSTFDYDFLGRAVREVTPAFGGGTAQTLKEYNGLVTTTTNAKDQARIETRNINGQLVSVTDANNKTITYGYDADGSFETSTDSKGNVITSTFDSVGHKTEVNDPDKGSWRYYYNALGEVRREINGNGQEKWLSYDVLGRTVTRIDDVLGSQKQTTQSVYDNQFLGALDSQTLSSKDGSLIQFKQQAYDSYGRPTVTTTKNVGEQTLEHYNRTYYDGIGRAVIAQSSKAFATLTEFNSLGFPYLIKRADNDSELQRIISMNRRGKATEVKYLGSRTQIHGYDEGTGLKSSSSTDNVASQTFTFDVLGNLLTRDSSFDDNNDGVFDSTTAEVFDYDHLNRLNWHNINGSRYQSFCYDELGNVTHKNNGDVACTTAATHKYNGTKPHAVSEFGGRTFIYDNNGNLTSDQQRTISYSPFDKPTEISKNDQSVKFHYGANRARFERIDTIAANHKVITHSLGAFERIVTDKDNVTTTQENHYVGSLIINKKIESGDEATYLMVKDHLGSLVARLNASGQLQQRYRFDAFGQQHEIDGASILPVTSRTDITQKGFTGHEMVGSMDIIHMKGRIYDPIIGRFLQADPHVQAPKNMQNLNRYSYVLNNPLSYTDPSGFIFKKLFKTANKALGKFAPYLGLALMAIPGVGAWATATWYNAAAFGFVSGGVATGSLKGALNGALSAVVFHGIGEKFNAKEGFLENGWSRSHCSSCCCRWDPVHDTRWQVWAWLLVGRINKSS